MTTIPYEIDQELADFIESDVAFLVASSESNKPTITRGFGARVADNCSQVTVFVTDQQSARILDEVEKTGRIAINAAKITSYESYQLKGSSAQRVDLSIKDQRHIMWYLDAVQLEMTRVGVTPEQAAAVFQSKDSESLVGIRFTTENVFHQTPGPGAGKMREQK